MRQDPSPLPPPLAVTMGDPAGIGPEIVAKTLCTMSGEMPSVVLGDTTVMTEAVCRFAPDCTLRLLKSLDEAIFSPGVINLLPTSRLRYFPKPGIVSGDAGEAAYRAILRGIELAQAGTVAALVTAPIHKEALRAAGIPFPGHTEILADSCGTEDCGMMLFNEDLRVVLATVHLSLREAIDRIDRAGELKAIRLAQQAARTLGIAQPRVAVAGLNPHAGEGGLFGREEIEIIAPAIEQARAEGIDASGPWPGDTVFMQARRGKFDIVVAQYHDQGLIPVKYLGLEQGVNATVGLPFVRTSVDHGTAFDIAWQGRADPASLCQAMLQALHMAQVEGANHRAIAAQVKQEAAQ